MYSHTCQARPTTLACIQTEKGSTRLTKRGAAIGSNGVELPRSNGPVVGASTHSRTQWVGSPRETGERPTQFKYNSCNKLNIYKIGLTYINLDTRFDYMAGDSSMWVSLTDYDGASNVIIIK